MPIEQLRTSDHPAAVRNVHGTHRRLRWLFVPMLLAFFAAAMTQVKHASITFDEGPHLAVGYTTLRTGDFRLQPVHIHPPLANVLAAWPLLLQDDLPNPETIDGWGAASLSAITDTVVWQYPHPARIATAARTPIVLLGILLCAIVTRWATDLGGPSVGAVALYLCALDPNLIAHSALITTDMVTVTLSVATLYILYRFMIAPTESRPRQGLLVVAGILLGLAQLAKVSALMLVPITGLLLFLDAWNRERALGVAIGRATRHVLLLFVIAGFTIWAGYGFQIAPVQGWLIELPAATHIEIFRSLREHYDLGHPTFAFGHVSDHGWWWYFLAAFAVKTPLPVLIFMGIAGSLGLRQLAGCVNQWRRSPDKVNLSQLLRSRQASVAACLAIFPSLYGVAALFSTVNIGYRHLLPILPFLYIGIAQQIATTRPHKRLLIPARVLSAGLLVWLAFGTAEVMPAPLTFFNRIAGGPANGYRHLVDSNVDWGQNLWDLADWMRDHEEDHVYYAHYSPATPKVYGIDADFLPPDPRAVEFAPWRPEPGLYAIGATVLQGPYAPDINTYAWFRGQEPTAQLGNALFVYNVPVLPEPDWVILCEPYDIGRLQLNLRASDLRVIYVDCNQTQVAPSGIGYTLAPPDGWSQTHTNVTQFRTSEGEIAATLYEPHYVPPQEQVTSPTALDGPLSFLGHTVSENKHTVVLETHWLVKETPSRPLSLMAHLVDPGGSTVSVGDGLGFSVDQWRPGDKIIQRHTLTTPENLDPENCELWAGAYWLDTMERMSILVEGQPADDYLTLSTHTAAAPEEHD